MKHGRTVSAARRETAISCPSSPTGAQGGEPRQKQGVPGVKEVELSACLSDQIN